MFQITNQKTFKIAWSSTLRMRVCTHWGDPSKEACLLLNVANKSCANPGPPYSSSAMLSPPFLIKYSSLDHAAIMEASLKALGWACPLPPGPERSGKYQEKVEKNPSGWAPDMMSVLRILRHLGRKTDGETRGKCCIQWGDHETDRIWNLPSAAWLNLNKQKVPKKIRRKNNHIAERKLDIKYSAMPIAQMHL